MNYNRYMLFLPCFIKRVNDTQIPQLNVNYLGLRLDNNFTRRVHIKEKKVVKKIILKMKEIKRHSKL